MTDYADLKTKAEAAKDSWDDEAKREVGSDWYTRPWLDEQVGLGEIEDAEYIAAASPDVVLALIAENERLREQLAEAQSEDQWNRISWKRISEVERERAEAAEAQLTEMREALLTIAENSDDVLGRHVARAALASPVSREAKPPLTVEDE